MLANPIIDQNNIGLLNYILWSIVNDNVESLVYYVREWFIIYYKL